MFEFLDALPTQCGFFSFSAIAGGVIGGALHSPLKEGLKKAWLHGVTLPHKKHLAQTTIGKWLAEESHSVLLDTETTGLDEHTEIVEISVIDMHGNILMDSLIKPTKPIPKAATQVHGITDEMVANAPAWPEVFEQFKHIINGKTVITFNAAYDERMISQTSKIHGIEAPKMTTGCAMKAYADYWGELDKKRGGTKWQSLEKAITQQNIKRHGDAHRSVNDCLNTLSVLIAAMKNH